MTGKHHELLWEKIAELSDKNTEDEGEFHSSLYRLRVQRSGAWMRRLQERCQSDDGEARKEDMLCTLTK